MGIAIVQRRFTSGWACRLAAAAAIAAGAAFAADQEPPPPPLTTCRAVRDFVADPALRRPTIDLEAVVIDQDPGRTALFLRDETGVTFATTLKQGDTFEPRRRGDRVRVLGRPYAGLVYGGMKARSITLLGTGPVEPRPITADELVKGTAHHDLVVIECVGRTLAPGEQEAASLVVNFGGRPVDVVFESPVEADDLRRLVDADLRIVGRAAGDANNRHELIRTFLRVRSLADVEVVEPAPADAFAGAITPFLQVRPMERRSQGHRIKVAGVATAAGVAGGIFLCAPGGGRDREDIGLFVEPAATAPAVAVAPGDLVEAVGFPAEGVFSAFLAAAEVRVTGRAAVPPPHPIVPSTVRQHNWLALQCDNERVEVAVEVLSRVDRPEATEIEAANELATFRIVAPRGLSPDIRAGAALQVRGMARATAVRQDEAEKSWLVLPSCFDLFVTAADDIVFTPPPWWTWPRVVAALGGALVAMAAAAALAAGFAVGLRRTIRRQVALLERKMEDEVVVEERRRIAREFHDSLEQDLAGLALRLDAAAGTAADDDTRGMLERQRSLVSRLQAETRQFVWDLRDPERSRWSLAELLAAQIEDQQATAGVPIRLRLE
ncbi:MAG: histidine kinase, partial [Planctomycetia bacterium]